MRQVLGGIGLVVLAVCWLGPLPALAQNHFSAHMTIHMGLIAVAAPLLVLAICGTRWDPVFRWPIFFSPILASIAELVIVWAWHTPRMHHAARHTALGLIAEQGTFLFCGLWLWLSAFGGDVQRNPGRAAAGVIGLLLTSMHMTLLGALILFATRPLFHHTMSPGHLSAQTDQQLGGAIMLVVGGAAYLAGGLWLMFGILRDPVLHSKASLR